MLYNPALLRSNSIIADSGLVLGQQVASLGYAPYDIAYDGTNLLIGQARTSSNISGFITVDSSFIVTPRTGSVKYAHSYIWYDGTYLVSQGTSDAATNDEGLGVTGWNTGTYAISYDDAGLSNARGAGLIYSQLRNKFYSLSDRIPLLDVGTRWMDDIYTTSGTYNMSSTQRLITQGCNNGAYNYVGYIPYPSTFNKDIFAGIWAVTNGSSITTRYASLFTTNSSSYTGYTIPLTGHSDNWGGGIVCNDYVIWSHLSEPLIMLWQISSQTKSYIDYSYDIKTSGLTTLGARCSKIGNKVFFSSDVTNGSTTYMFYFDTDNMTLYRYSKGSYGSDAIHGFEEGFSSIIYCTSSSTIGGSAQQKLMKVT